ncbi:MULTISPECIES: DUF4349 domain-containing protein [unclassified Duganella]|uniref:DUF4349 domain-containing protein n=1 Tax=unclassified Duganella TaxID=2636909 RepID=UPI0006FD9EA6|nr:MULTISPECIES: DUF4349 domain-containing protein [unclassified Duganella]KQV54437.1 hypothetical protein ASD07_07920 [Duganella sp. Root336D2]KRC03563.1 hypothetical protein ASE26_01645 [Duganella sp. Root198D2]
MAAHAADGSPASAVEAQRGKYLAYEHSVTVDSPEGGVKPLLDKLVAACQADAANQCTLLASGVAGGRESSAHIRVRVKRAGIEKLIALAATGGEVASRNTSAEDLEGPIRDNAKRLDMLRSYREKLLALESKVGSNAEALIKLSQELATVQSELESATGAEARLMERVNMDLLNISIQSRTQRGFWSPVKRSLSDFGSNLSEGIATAITGTAYMLPWVLILFALGLLVRKVWRKLRKQ